MIPYYMIVNLGTMQHSQLVRDYPFHLVLAQLWMESADYRKAVADLKASREGKRFDLILDNGAHEGVVIKSAEYFYVMTQVQPTCVVLPDRIGENHLDSREVATNFADQLLRTYEPGHIRMMYVPQGADQTQILDEFEWAMNALDPNLYTLGFGQSYLKWENKNRQQEAARSMLMADVLSMPQAERANFHILGARWKGRNIASCWEDRKIVGLDTIKPCTCAMYDRCYPDQPCTLGSEYLNQPVKVDRLSNIVVDDALLWANVAAVCSTYGLEAPLDPIK